MLKKLQLFLLGLMAASCLMAQPSPKSVTISESNIQFWTGSGTNSTVVAIGWDDDDASYTPTVVVWGIHWNGTITLLDALDTLMAYDSHFSYSISGSYLTGVTYNDPNAGVSLTPSAGWNCNNYNGVYGFTNLSTSTWLRISESTCDNYNFTGVNNLIYASNPNNSGNTTLPDTVDASLPFSDILFWVGTGTDSAEFIVNFAQPDTAFAWGYLFNSTTTAQAMVNAIAAADPRFWTEGSPSSGGDIFFLLDNGDTLSLSPVDPNVGWNFWWTNLNGVSAEQHRVLHLLFTTVMSSNMATSIQPLAGIWLGATTWKRLGIQSQHPFLFPPQPLMFPKMPLSLLPTSSIGWALVPTRLSSPSIGPTPPLHGVTASTGKRQSPT